VSNPILSVAVHALVVLGVAASWELVAYAMHRWVMHGFGWFLHEDHHRSSGRRLQKNDAYALFFALCSFLLIYNGLLRGWSLVAAAGFGVALYGLGYVLFHDIMFHKRLRWLRLPARGAYLGGIVAAHRVHHATSGRRGATSFGFLYAPPRFRGGAAANGGAGAGAGAGDDGAGGRP
jgi:beta-carotene 3-hydroxylase